MSSVRSSKNSSTLLTNDDTPISLTNFIGKPERIDVFSTVSVAASVLHGNDPRQTESNASLVTIQIYMAPTDVTNGATPTADELREYYTEQLTDPAVQVAYTKGNDAFQVTAVAPAIMSFCVVQVVATNPVMGAVETYMFNSVLPTLHETSAVHQGSATESTQLDVKANTLSVAQCVDPSNTRLKVELAHQSISGNMPVSVETALPPGTNAIGTVDLAAGAAVALPAGASTAHLQTTGNTALSSIAQCVDTTNTRLKVELAHESISGNLPVTLATALPPGTNAIGTVNLAAGAAVALPAGASTADLQTTGNTTLGNIETKATSIDNKITSCNTNAVVVSSSALPAGAATESTLSAIDTKLGADLAVVNGSSGVLTVQGAGAGGQHAVGRTRTAHSNITGVVATDLRNRVWARSNIVEMSGFESGYNFDLQASTSARLSIRWAKQRSGAIEKRTGPSTSYPASGGDPITAYAVTSIGDVRPAGSPPSGGTGGSGFGARYQIHQIAGGAVTAVSIFSGGGGYAVGDYVELIPDLASVTTPAIFQIPAGAIKADGQPTTTPIAASFGVAMRSSPSDPWNGHTIHTVPATDLDESGEYITASFPLEECARYIRVYVGEDDRYMGDVRVDLVGLS